MPQCQGITRKGERCPRDAQAGSAYCTIHLDQAVRAPRAKEVPPWDEHATLATALGLALVATVAFLGVRR